MTAPEYVAARHVLLDALGALHDHLDNLILVGAQAVYLHTGDGTLNVPPMTTDADLALNTQRLAGTPEIAQTLIDAGFTPSTNPGHWLGTQDVAIDIMVVPHQAGTTSKTARSARIPPHTLVAHQPALHAPGCRGLADRGRIRPPRWWTIAVAAHHRVGQAYVTHA